MEQETIAKDKAHESRVKDDILARQKDLLARQKDLLALQNKIAATTSEHAMEDQKRAPMLWRIVSRVAVQHLEGEAAGRAR